MRELNDSLIKTIELIPFPTVIIELSNKSIKIHYINKMLKELNKKVEIVTDSKTGSGSVYNGMCSKDIKLTKNVKKLVDLLGLVNSKEIGFHKYVYNKYSKRDNNLDDGTVVNLNLR